ncbi:MFS transporter [Rathayibacter iranicus]|uniref:MFS transporter n=3 Tax=Rathayibacter iranicus TaxID=59737 RepID=A0AAD1EN77_9MICO|nr:MFS transporter [Rathayibacter iranicus]PPI42394.1 MFS transporter [Rathayibacter iranicus]PPI57816.1 MFS transporter [Rathayibacter iranicus]PPI68754.1 MFS transporter [Rathayibacter iranicus]PWJ66559.1 MFS transporter [Rathayibacter iranicus] [Rathayibacter iranicus NCPPB 2253 = VKM Ac-1602]
MSSGSQPVVGTADPRDTRMAPRDRWRLTVLMGVTFMLAVDFSVLNVALPDIGVDLRIPLNDLQWVVTAFTLPAAGLGLFFGRLGDLAGRRGVLLAAMLLLAAGSVLGAVATEAWVLIVARVLQGLATAAAAPTALALLTTTFKEGPVRDRALGLNGALLSAGFATGALLGGALTSSLSWRAAFWINVPVAVFVLVFAPFLFPESRPAVKTRLDFAGALSITLSLSCFVLGVSSAAIGGFGDPGALMLFAAALILVVLFALIELRGSHPLVPLAVLKRKNVRWGNLGGLTTFGMMSSFTYLTTLFLQLVLGLDPVITGAVIAIIGIVAVVGALFVPRLIGAVGQVRVLVGGLVVQGAGTVIVALAGDHSGSILIICLGLAVATLGHIASIIAYTVTATSGLPDGEQGLATGLTSTSQQVALALGTPVLAAAVTVIASAEGLGSAATSGTALSGAMLLNAAVCIAIAVLVLIGFLRTGKSQA